MRLSSCLVLSSLAIAASSGFVIAAGPYTDAGIPAADPRFVGWANSVAAFNRGPQNISVVGSPLASFGASSDALGTPTGTGVVSLGDGGSATLGFGTAIKNGTGADFAVFENGFTSAGGVFAELGFVEVSSDGTNFFRFPSVSLTQTSTQFGNANVVDPTDISNLAGKHLANQGTGFDLADLVGISPLLNVNAVTQVRIIDVVGAITAPYGTQDSQGHFINDPWPTAFASSGFDLDAVGVINAVTPEPTVLALGAAALAIAARRRRSN